MREDGRRRFGEPMPAMAEEWMEGEGGAVRHGWGAWPEAEVEGWGMVQEITVAGQGYPILQSQQADSGLLQWPWQNTALSDALAFRNSFWA